MTSHYVPFSLHGETFFLKASIVREIMGRQACTLVPHATGHVPGVFPWNGRAVAMIEVASLLRLGSKGPSDENRQRTLLVQWEDDVFGLSVDSVFEPVTIDTENFRPVHAAEGLFTEAEIEWSGAVARLLDVSAMLDACFQEG